MYIFVTLEFGSSIHQNDDSVADIFTNIWYWVIHCGLLRRMLFIKSVRKFLWSMTSDYLWRWM